MSALNYKTITIKDDLNIYPVAYLVRLDSTSVKDDFYEYFDKVVFDISNIYSLDSIVNHPKIKISRDGYKKLKIDPSRYRLACESLYRRIVKNKTLPHISPLVDIGNLLSLLVYKSVCVADYEKIIGNITIRKGTNLDIYETIGRGIINVNNMPLYCDEIGPFGSMTSDTKRTMIKDDIKNIFIMITSFTPSDIDIDQKILEELLNKYLEIKEIRKL